MSGPGHAHGGRFEPLKQITVPRPSLALRPTERWAERLYFCFQSLRNGVDRSQVRVTSHLLDGSEEDIREHITRRLKKTHHPRGDDPLAWLDQQPLMDRSSLRDDASTLPWYRRFRRLELKKTSGSTGHPVRLCKDMEMAAQIDATMWALYAWHGIAPGMRHARFWGVPRGRVNQTIRQSLDTALQRKRFNAFQLTERRVKEFFFELLRFKPRYVHGYPSLVDEFVRVASQESLDGRDLGVRVVFLTGEMLRDPVRERVAAFFEAQVVNEYGCSESGLLAFGCEFGHDHLIPASAYPEVLDSEHRRVSSGGIGEAVVTDLYGSHLPLLRYRLGDLIEVAENSSCPCGRSLPMVSISAGRISSMVILPDGSRLFPAVISYAMPPGIRRFQAKQLAEDHFEVLIEVQSSEIAEVAMESCERGLKTALGGEVRIEVRITDKIPQDPSGKLRYFIPLSEGQST